MMKQLLFSCFVICVSFFSTGCTTLGASTVSTQDFNRRSGRREVSQVSKLVVGNVIEVSVEVDGRMEVSMHRASLNYFGKVTLPLVGDVKVGGLSLDGARTVVARTYGAYFVNPPVIMVSLIEDPVDGEWGYVTVTGQVEQPGRVKIQSSKGIKLTSVIQESGGFAGSAKKNEIRISRQGKGGQKIRVIVDYREIGQEGNVDADVDLQDGDIVYIPERIF